MKVQMQLNCITTETETNECSLNKCLPFMSAMLDIGFDVAICRQVAQQSSKESFLTVLADSGLAVGCREAGLWDVR